MVCVFALLRPVLFLADRKYLKNCIFLLITHRHPLLITIFWLGLTFYAGGGLVFMSLGLCSIHTFFLSIRLSLSLVEADVSCWVTNSPKARYSLVV